MAADDRSVDSGRISAVFAASRDAWGSFPSDLPTAVWLQPGESPVPESACLAVGTDVPAHVGVNVDPCALRHPVDLASRRFSNPYMRSRLRRARGIGEALVVDTRQMERRDREYRRVLALASAVVVDSDTVLDALACGAPAVAATGTSHAIGLPAGLVPEADETALMSKASVLGRDPLASSAAALAGRRHVEAHHDLDLPAVDLIEALGAAAPVTPLEAALRRALSGISAADDAAVRGRISRVLRGLDADPRPKEGPQVTRQPAGRARMKDRLRPFLHRTLAWFVREEARGVADEELGRSDELVAELTQRLDDFGALDARASAAELEARLEILKADVRAVEGRVQALEEGV
ncbi:MAG: hypothetical protein IT198_10875 [Acidimicrobiia bacterium]|nr:hypothetical protein [Acidimicrobiia bacterium]